MMQPLDISPQEEPKRERFYTLYGKKAKRKVGPKTYLGLNQDVAHMVVTKCQKCGEKNYVVLNSRICLASDSQCMTIYRRGKLPMTYPVRYKTNVGETVLEITEGCEGKIPESKETLLDFGGFFSFPEKDIIQEEDTGELTDSLCVLIPKSEEKSKEE